jgi:DNA-binding NarL/FixJ family response regulator
VDDSASFRKAAAGLLATLGQVEVVGMAASGAEGIDAVETLAPDLVLMDMDMPGMSGLTAMREIKRRWRDVVVVIVTFHEEAWHRTASRAGGADGFLAKQSFADECATLIAKLLTRVTPVSPDGSAR